MTRLLPLVALLPLAACAHHRDSKTPPAPQSAACRTDLLKVLIGRPGSAVLAGQALDLSGAQAIRWIHPGEAVTMDYREDRLNIKLTRGNIVKSFVCG